MRSLLALVAGGPARVSVSAAAIVAIAFVVNGSGWDLARAAWTLVIAAAGFSAAFMALAIAGSAAGVIEQPPLQKEPDRG
jgi:hypothetical protein